MNESTPLQSDDAPLEVLAGNEVQFIEAFVDLGKLTPPPPAPGMSARATPTRGREPLGVRPSMRSRAKRAQPPSRPVVIGNTDIYIQALGNIVRVFRFDILTRISTTARTSRSSPPTCSSAVPWCRYFGSGVKDSIVWMVMSDGSLLTLTYASHVAKVCPGVGYPRHREQERRLSSG